MEAIKPVRVAVIGCGAISGIYFENMTVVFPFWKWPPAAT